MVPAGAVQGEGAAVGPFDVEAIAPLGPRGGPRRADLGHGYPRLGGGGAELGAVRARAEDGGEDLVVVASSDELPQALRLPRQDFAGWVGEGHISGPQASADAGAAQH